MTSEIKSPLKKFWKARYNLQDVRVFPGPLIRAKATSLICTGTATTQKIWQLAANFEETSVSFKVSAIVTIREIHNICICAQVCKEHHISTSVCYKCIKKAQNIILYNNYTASTSPGINYLKQFVLVFVSKNLQCCMKRKQNCE